MITYWLCSVSPFILVIVATWYLFRKTRIGPSTPGVAPAERSISQFIPYLLWALSLAIALLCSSTQVWFYNLDAPGIDKGQEMAQPVIAAIVSYRQMQGKYPDQLDDLIPEYIAAIPKPSWRHSYCYDLREDGLSFTLAFVPQGEAIGDGWNVYSSKLQAWHRTDSDFYQPCQFSFDLK
jgi:hypothetical protein